MKSYKINGSLLKQSFWMATVGLGLGLSFPAPAALIIENVGNINLLASQPNQPITFRVYNDNAEAVNVTGIQFNIQIGLNEQVGLRPAITAVDILSDTIFDAGNNNGMGGGQDGSNTWRWEVYTLADASTPVPAGYSTLATVTFDTATDTLNSGSWNVYLTTPASETVYFGSSVNDPIPIGGVSLPIGTLTIVPEPTHVALGLFGGLVLVRGWVRWRRRIDCVPSGVQWW